MDKKNIAVVCGGWSGEFGISVQSGRVVIKHLDPCLYNVYKILITKDEWYCISNDDIRIPVNLNDFCIDTGRMIVRFDCVFNAIHGTPGEDGRLQGYLDMLGVPHTSSGVVTSALTFNKYLCRLAVQSLEIKIAPAVLLRSISEAAEAAGSLKLPFFVKPNSGGSSVGMTRVNEMDRLEAAVELALKEDNQALVEEFIPGREITCGVIRYKDELITLPVTEIISKKDFFDFEAKYDPSLADEIVPADIPDSVASECKKLSAFLYRELDCAGMVRFDYIFNENGIFFLEMNTVPGMTEASILPKMAYSHGLTLRELFGMAVEEALAHR